MDYVEKLIATRRRNRRIVLMVDKTGNQSVTARKFGLSRQRIEQIYKKAKQDGATPRTVRPDRP